MRLVTVAHGTRDPAGNHVARTVTAAASARAGLPGVCSFVELAEPSLAAVLGAADRPAVVVPLLLSTGHHVRIDLPAAVSTARGAGGLVRLCPPLGPHRLLAAAQVDRLQRAGATAGTQVVMVAAGSRDAAAALDLDRAGRLLGEAWGRPVRVATLGGRGRRVAEVVRPGDAVSPYLLAPGLFAARLAEEARAAGVGAVAAVIGPHPAVVELVVMAACSPSVSAA